MSHTYASLLFHCVFSTKGRKRWLTPEVCERLWPFMGGIARKNKFVLLGAGGMEDHVHLLVSMPTTLEVAKAVQSIKAGSSNWLHKNFVDFRAFEWQEGYGAFSISISHKNDTLSYIREQSNHHRRKTFQDEFLTFLHKHKIEYDERYIWD